MFQVLIFFLVLTSLVLFFFAFQHFSKNIPEYGRKHKKNKSGKPRSRCPICNSPLEPGEKLISKVYPTPNATDERCVISGCPHCQPFTEMGVIRQCPVCGKKIPLDGTLIARMFIKPESRNHVHIIGCTECHKK